MESQELRHTQKKDFGRDLIQEKKDGLHHSGFKRKKCRYNLFTRD